MSDYQSFLARKAIVDMPTGFDPGELNPMLFHFQKDVTKWALRRGRAAIFEDCGLGKSFQQIEWCYRVTEKTNKPTLIVCPLCVAEQFVSEGSKLGIEVTHLRHGGRVEKAGVYVINYERLHLIVAADFIGVSLDEAGILKNYSGKIRTQIIEIFARTPYKIGATATPSPNDYMELGNHAEFLGVMTRAEMLSMFFVHDGGDTSQWRLKGHAESEFWKWLCSWAVNIRKPSDLGYDDAGFNLPPLTEIEHIIETEETPMEGMLFALPANTLNERRQARRASLGDRVQKVVDLVNSHDRPAVVWCNLNDESEALAKAINGAVEVTGSQDEETKEAGLKSFCDGSKRAIVSKGSICGWGQNWQHCADVYHCGLNDSQEEKYQKDRRCYRFGQKKPVTVHVVISGPEIRVLENIKRKQVDADRMAVEMVRHMAAISSVEIRGSKRDLTEYKPTKKIKLPAFLK